MTCFSYSPVVPPEAGNLGAAQPAQPALPGLLRMPNPCYSYPLMCFSYPDDAPWAAPGRDTVPPALPGLRRTPFGSCFRY
jgi:hypothetical protein